ncbi:hypothetical protein MMC30_008526 [Trapelia coarctata]|nr:hypothetical protein [Trapelia coarctata]
MSPGELRPRAVPGKSFSSPSEIFSRRKDLYDPTNLADETPESVQKAWRKQLVLSIDGGTPIGGVATLMILQRLMERIRAYESKDVKTAKPCLYFDYAFGSGTGGLIAIMLGRLRMSVDDALDEYTRLLEVMLDGHGFKGPISRVFMGGSLQRRNSEDFEKAFQHIIDRADGEHQMSASEDQMKTVVLAAQRTNLVIQAHLFRTYLPVSQPSSSSQLSLKSFENPKDVKIWQAARATSAAPTYFSPVQIKDEQFVDGGLLENNPTWTAIQEVRSRNSMDPRVKLNEVFGAVVSIGTGVRSRSRISGTDHALKRFHSAATEALKVATESQDRHLELRSLAQSEGLSYFRFLADMEDLDLQTKRGYNERLRSKVRETVIRSFSSTEMDRELTELAQTLVKYRHVRSLDHERISWFDGADYSIDDTDAGEARARDERTASQRTNNPDLLETEHASVNPLPPTSTADPQNFFTDLSRPTQAEENAEVSRHLPLSVTAIPNIHTDYQVQAIEHANSPADGSKAGEHQAERVVARATEPAVSPQIENSRSVPADQPIEVASVQDPSNSARINELQIRRALIYNTSYNAVLDMLQSPALYGIPENHFKKTPCKESSEPRLQPNLWGASGVLKFDGFDTRSSETLTVMSAQVYNSPNSSRQSNAAPVATTNGGIQGSIVALLNPITF